MNVDNHKSFPPCQGLFHLAQKSYLYVKIKNWLYLLNIIHYAV